MLQIFLLLSDITSKSIDKKHDTGGYFHDQNYNFPFSDENILDMFSSKSFEVNPLYDFKWWSKATLKFNPNYIQNYEMKSLTIDKVKQSVNIVGHGVPKPSSQNYCDFCIDNLFCEISLKNHMHSGVNWSSTNNTNKLCHILFGNRRNMGYSYFIWNCDRGFISKNKLEDIKLVAHKYHPHFMGISEIDVKKNENNSDDKSTNIFSTEQLQDKFNIEGYKILLPDS